MINNRVLFLQIIVRQTRFLFSVSIYVYCSLQFSIAVARLNWLACTLCYLFSNPSTITHVLPLIGKWWGGGRIRHRRPKFATTATFTSGSWGWRLIAEQQVGHIYLRCGKWWNVLNVYLFLIANSVCGLALKHVQVHASMSKSVDPQTHTHTYTHTHTQTHIHINVHACLQKFLWGAWLWMVGCQHYSNTGCVMCVVGLKWMIKFLGCGMITN